MSSGFARYAFAHRVISAQYRPSSITESGHIISSRGGDQSHSHSMPCLDIGRNFLGSIKDRILGPLG